MKKYKTDGYIVTDGESCMGIFSTVRILNEKIEENEKLKKSLEHIKPNNGNMFKGDVNEYIDNILGGCN